MKYERYEIRDGEVVVSPDRERVLQRWSTNDDDDGWTFYWPIDDVPDLFLRFARLYGESDFNKAALDFANKYGLPTGADETDPSGRAGFKTDALNWSLAQFRHEARRAWVILALYEAVLNDEDRTVRKLLAEHGDIKPFKRGLSYLEPLGPAEHQNLALALGLKCAVEATKEIVHKYIAASKLCCLWIAIQGQASLVKRTFPGRSITS